MQEDETSALKERLLAAETELNKTRFELQSRLAELTSVKEENDMLNQSVDELDREHDVIVNQLITQRDDLKRKNESLTEELDKSSTQLKSPTDQDREVVDELKSKLQTASFSLNELHMAKGELASELTTTKAKVLR